jgi:glycerophosphoryl diester phosphodiesterase
MAVFDVHDYVERRLPLQCCAHRGFSGLYPENTLLSLTKAVEIQADLIEFDVRVSKDKKLVVIHDSKVDRTTDGSGLVSELTFQELRAFDAGWGQTIPAFEEVIDELGGRIGMNIHMKNSGKALDTAIQCCRKAGILDNVFFAIEPLEEIKRIMETYPNVHICSLFRKGDYLETTQQLNVRILQPTIYATYFTKDWVDQVHQAGCVCGVFYADTVSNILYCQRLGVDGILTNHSSTFLQNIRS